MLRLLHLVCAHEHRGLPQGGYQRCLDCGRKQAYAIGVGGIGRWHSDREEHEERKRNWRRHCRTEVRL